MYRFKDLKLDSDDVSQEDEVPRRQEVADQIVLEEQKRSSIVSIHTDSD